MWHLAFLAGLSVSSAFALIFPLVPGTDGSYDERFHAITGYRSAWATNQHAVYNVASANGVAVAPRWLLTAGHIAGQMDENWYVNDDTTRYWFRERVDLGNDLALIRVDQPMPFYSELQKFSGGKDDILTVYGQSAAPREPLRDTTGVVRGWRFPPLTNAPALRWGRGRRLAASLSSIQWDFTTGDAALGSGGLDCAGVCTNDSGGGIFVGSRLVGITTGLLTQGFRESPDDPVQVDCDLHPPGLLFDNSVFYRCTSAIRPITRAYGAAVYPVLSNIFAHIAPPRFLNFGGESIAENGRTWEKGECGNCSAYSEASAVIDVSRVTNAAPEAVYRSAAYVRSTNGAPLAIKIPELIKYEKYNIRIHFASVFPADAGGKCLQLVAVNGASQLFDPYKGAQTASALLFANIRPSDTGEITITLTPANPDGYAALSGIEIWMPPLVPPAAQTLKSDVVASYPGRVDLQDVIFGNGKFLANGSALFMSEDAGGTWAHVPSPIAGRPILFAAGKFLAVGANGGLFTSEDGRTWIPSLEQGAFSALACGNGVWIAVGQSQEQGLVARSMDLIHWDLQEGVSATPLAWTVFGNDRFLAGNLVFSSFLSSADGLHWVTNSVELPAPDPDCTSGCPSWWYPGGIIFARDRFLSYALASVRAPNAYAFWLPSSLLASGDGARWEVQSRDIFSPRADGRLRYVNEKLVYLPAQIYSSDFTNWHSFLSPLFPEEMANTNSWQILSAIAYGQSNYVAVGGLDGSANVFPQSLFVARGLALESLERVDRPVAPHERSHVANSGSTLVIVNPYPGDPIPLLVSTNSGAGFTSAFFPLDSRGARAVQHADGLFVVVGEAGRIMTSSDGVRWSKSSNESTNDLSAVAFGNGVWVAGGADGTLVRSPDGGATFQKISAPVSQTLNALTFGAPGFVAVGNGGTVLKSLDGLTWSTGGSLDRDLFGVTYGAGLYLVCGANGYVYSSSDAQDWFVARPAGLDLFDAAYADGIFFVLGQGNPAFLHASVDGKNWSAVPTLTGTTSIDSSEDALWSWVPGTTSVVARLRLPDPNLHLAGEVIGDGSLALRFNAPVSGSYSILSADRLNATWSSEAELTRGDSDQLSFVSTNAVSRSKFYRLRLN